MANNYKKGDHDTRPWGTWEVLDAGDNFCVKKITVTPGNILSLQSHNHRAEHWTVVEGEALVTLGDEKVVCKADEGVYIPVQTKHRIQNNTKKIWCLLKFRPVIIWMKMTSSAMRTLTAEFKIIKARINPEPYFFYHKRPPRRWSHQLAPERLGQRIELRSRPAR